MPTPLRFEITSVTDLKNRKIRFFLIEEGVRPGARDREIASVGLGSAADDTDLFSDVMAAVAAHITRRIHAYCRERECSHVGPDFPAFLGRMEMH